MIAFAKERITIEVMKYWRFKSNESEERNDQISEHQRD